MAHAQSNEILTYLILSNVTCILTHARDAISRVPRVTRAVGRALGVGTVGVSVTVVVIVRVRNRMSIGCTFVNV